MVLVLKILAKSQEPLAEIDYRKLLDLYEDVGLILNQLGTAKHDTASD